ncbi:ferric hydroxamate/heme transport system permease protein [Cytobacillus horneckiae]|uniref:Iron ABC transporter permease n=1 Tax=Cytobacillus horneckiae TaxID=549687 RepID=A0A2N0ZHG4_9BACI|nr:iron ABC transporter permease [Cytobacillus horneckiae]MBN6887748.1 iron ABC transporter permease [Cytobacillus horneckiae]MEC1159189.1 iron ABC transporter permease [Cytobacillus horneckiae]MED2938968.1 iron ABC transporter permease [Cytobacillus horneckiae]PKG28965.1 iron ABC transporter permease [Cytobacillus horneckiae]
MNQKKLKRTGMIISITAILLLIAFIISVATGFASMSPLRLVNTLLGQGTPKEELILFTFRLPRILVTILAGVGLAISGAILQSITRNPLADPGILGINAGAGLAVVFFVMIFGSGAGTYIYILPLFALCGGMITAIIIYLLSFKKGEGIDPGRMLLVGVGLSTAISGAILTLASKIAREDYDFFANWMAGRIWGDDWVFVLALLPWLLLLLPLVYRKSNVLNTMSLNENLSIGLGVKVEKERYILLLIAVALAASAVSVSGGIAFVGLMAPHIARSLVGPRHQLYLPVAAMLGAILLLIADTIGRVLLDPSGIPAGVIVSIIGAPYFMYLMAKK